MTTPPRLETCQRGCVGIPVDERGRTGLHWDRGRVGVHCPAERSASLQESARRRQRREEQLRALAVDLKPAASPALDAMIEGRSEYRSRRRDFIRVALREFNLQHGTQWARPFEQHGPPGSNAWIGGRCRFCGGRLESVVRRPRQLSESDQAHIEQCALEYLAGLQRTQASAADIVYLEPKPETVIALDENEDREHKE